MNGALTGTPLAGALGRWPTEMAARAALGRQLRAGRAAECAERANAFAMAICVDDLSTFADSVGAAVAPVRAWQEELLAQWQLVMKPCSCEIMGVARGPQAQVRVRRGLAATICAGHFGPPCLQRWRRRLACCSH